MIRRDRADFGCKLCATGIAKLIGVQLRAEPCAIGGRENLATFRHRESSLLAEGVNKIYPVAERIDHAAHQLDIPGTIVAELRRQSMRAEQRTHDIDHLGSRQSTRCTDKF